MVSMKKFFSILLPVLCAAILLAGCGLSMDKVIATKPHFRGTVTELSETCMLVEVAEGEEAHKSSDRIWVSLDIELPDGKAQYHVGDEVCVYYDGSIAESYPAQVHKVYAVTIVTPAGRNENTEAEAAG